METAEVHLNDLLPNEILIKIFEYYNHKVLANMSLVCKRWLELIGNTTHICEKFPIFLNSDNITQMIKRSAVKQLRPCKPIKVVVHELNYEVDVAGRRKLCKLFAGAKDVTFSDMYFYNIHPILALCKQVEKVKLDSPEITRKSLYGMNHDMHFKRRLLNPKFIDIDLQLIPMNKTGDIFYDILVILDELNIEPKTMKFTHGFDLSYGAFADILDVIATFYPNCVLTSLDLGDIKMKKADYTNLVAKLNGPANFQLTHFKMPWNSKMQEADLVRIMASQPNIKNLELEDKHTKLLAPYAVENMPQLEELTLDVEKNAIPFFINAINGLKWPNLRELCLFRGPDGLLNLEFLDVLPQLKRLEISEGQVTIPPLKGALKALKELVLSRVVVDGSLQVLKNMPNLTLMSIKINGDLTLDMLVGAGEAYSIGNLTNLEKLTMTGDFLWSKELAAVMKLPYLKELGIYGSGAKLNDDLPLSDQEIVELRAQCPNLRKINCKSLDDLSNRERLSSASSLSDSSNEDSCSSVDAGMEVGSNSDLSNEDDCSSASWETI